MDDKEKKIQIKFIRFYETAKKCLILIDKVYSRIEENILGLESDKNDKESMTCELYIDLFTFIDFAHRFLQIIDSIPLLSKKKYEVRELNKTLDVVKRCRNYLQHMKEHLAKEEVIDYPILGSFSWISDDRNYIILPTQFTQNNKNAGIAYDTYENVYVCKYQFSIGGFELKIDNIYSEIKEFWDWFDKMARIKPEELKNYSWGNPNIIYSMFKFNNKE